MKDPLPGDIFRPGQVLNNTYEIRGILGRGGTGEVYLAINQISERTLAIKALNAQFAANADYIELMKREEQMRNILHDCVVRYSECSRSDEGHVFLVMDYIEGPSLNEVMHGLRLSDHDLLIVAHRVLEGLVPTHAHGIIHRDLSPDNIILRGGDPKRATIIDFGIAKDTSPGARTIVGNNFAGKYEYAAPEQLDGRSDGRADLYALGATLLAAFRREVPDVGTTPTAVVRAKHVPLDTSGVPQPLKDLIELLTATNPDDRPESAAAALTQLDRWLKPDSTRPDARRTGNGGMFRGALIGGLVVAGGAGLWMSGVAQRIFPDPLPVAAPYTLSASLSPDGVALSGHAPDADTATALHVAFADATGQPPPLGTLSLADGLPSADWPIHAADLLALTKGLTRWDLSLSDQTATLSGIAPDTGARDALTRELATWQTSVGLSLTTDILAGPETLNASDLTPVLDSLATCGPLAQLDGPNAQYALRETITITGDTASAPDTIAPALKPLIGDRTLRVETTTLNKDLCAIRAVLPASATGAISIWLGRGDTQNPVLTGVFHTGQNPVVDVQLPADLTGASLWVMVVDNTGKVFHILPNINQPNHQIDTLGTVTDGIRRVRVLWPVSALAEDGTRLAMRVNEGDYGKSEVIAILSRDPLFDMRRPRDESVASVAEALSKTLQTRPNQIIGVASRIIDARP